MEVAVERMNVAAVHRLAGTLRAARESLIPPAAPQIDFAGFGPPVAGTAAADFLSHSHATQLAVASEIDFLQAAADKAATAWSAAEKRNQRAFQGSAHR